METARIGAEHDALVEALEDAMATLTLVVAAAHHLGAEAGTAASSLAPGPHFEATVELRVLESLLVAAHAAIDRCRKTVGPSPDGAGPERNS
jgi:hypothetical protein